MERDDRDTIALGLVNTVDYEIEWDPAHLEKLICRTNLQECDIRKMHKICTLKDLLSSILFHMREGTGCGLWVEDPEVIETFLEGTGYRVTLGGTNLRAAQVISTLSGRALVHLVSVNENTLSRLPDGVKWVGGQKYRCCFPHIAIQFPKAARICANGVEMITPRANRVIYSGDIACAQMPLEQEFFTRAAGMRAMLVSGLDLVTDPAVLSMRLKQIQKGLKGFGGEKPLVFYEHACFADTAYEEMLQRELEPLLDIYSMNEDEFQTLAGGSVELLHADTVLKGLQAARKKLSDVTLVVHTGYWGLAYGMRAQEIRGALEKGMLAATARYWLGNSDNAGMDRAAMLPQQVLSKAFAEEIERISEEQVVCLPAAEVKPDDPTTVGLGDSFVGGFLYQYCFDRRKREA